MSVRKLSSSVVVTLLFVITLTLLGCGKAGPSLVPVTGSVTVDGKPANGATVIFHPTDKEQKLIPAASTDDGGKFKLATSTKVGAPVGSYDITVIWPDPSVQPSPAEKLSGTGPTPPDLLGGKYAKKGASGLKTEITSSTKELPPFALTK